MYQRACGEGFLGAAARARAGQLSARSAGDRVGSPFHADCMAHSRIPTVALLAPLQGAPLSSIPKPQIETGVKAKIPAAVCTCHSPDGQDFGAPIQFSERGSHSVVPRPSGRRQGAEGRGRAAAGAAAAELGRRSACGDSWLLAWMPCLGIWTEPAGAACRSPLSASPSPQHCCAAFPSCSRLAPQ